MSFRPSHNLRRTVVAILVSLFAIFILIPLLYDLAGIRTNLEEFIAPTRSVQVKPKTRVAHATATARAIFTSAPLPTAISRAPMPTVSALNNISVERLVLLSDSTRAHIRDIYALGQSLGRDARAVSKVGDSTMVYPPFLATFDRQDYRLGKFAYLEPTIHFHTGSFARESAAVKKGMHTWSQFDPAWSVPEMCAPTEGPLDCELRLHNPSIVIIRLGANDTDAPSLFERNLGAIVQVCLARGIIPVLGTKPDRYEGASNLINNLIRKTAAAYAIPLWDYDLIAGTVPGRGLEPDGLHMKGGGTRDYSSSAALVAGDALEDLTALMMLDAIRREIGADAAR
jgi:hypothetical protein